MTANVSEPILMVADRGAPVGFADAAKSTAPLPFTKEKEGMVSHVESDTGSQVQPAEPWTLKRPVVARAGTWIAAVVKDKVQLPPDCVTVKTCPLMAIVAVLIAAPGLTAAA